MENLTTRLNFSDSKIENSIEIPKWVDVNHYEILCLYCSENDIDLDNVTDEELDGCSELMKDYGQADKTTDTYFFSIDNL